MLSFVLVANAAEQAAIKANIRAFSKMKSNDFIMDRTGGQEMKLTNQHTYIQGTRTMKQGVEKGGGSGKQRGKAQSNQQCFLSSSLTK